VASDKNSIILNAQRLTAKGEIDKAIETWKSLIAETPNDGNTYNTIGDLYLKKNAQPRAIEAFLKAGETFQTAGFALKTIAVYKKIIKLDPARMDVVLKLADVNAERGIVGNAVEDYLKVARHELKEGRVKAAIDVYRKIAALDPANPTIGVKLAELCQKEGMVPEAREELTRVAGHLETAGKTAELSQIRAKLKELGGEVVPPPSPEETAAAPAPPPQEFVLEPTSIPAEHTESRSVHEQTAAAEPEPPREAAPAALPLEATLAPETAKPESTRMKSAAEFGETTHERMNDALTEADVYVKYGMVDKAIAHVQGLAQRDPGNIAVLMKLKELLIAQGDVKTAAAACVRAAAIHERLGQDAERDAALREARELNPESAAAGGQAVAKTVEAAATMSEAPTASATPSASAPAPVDPLEQDLAEADFYFQQGFDDEAQKLFSSILKKAPAHPIATQRLREIAERAGSRPPSVDADATIQPVGKPLAENSLGSDIAVGPIEPVAKAPQRNETTKDGEDYIDLADALREDMERSLPPVDAADPSADLSAERELESVFRKFQKGVQEQYGREDYETHYNLGIAYREMGLLNEAIGEFRLVLKSPDRVIPATSMLATCYREKGLLPRAEEILRKALDDPAHAGTEGMAGLAYELGQIIEVQGRHDDALAEYYRAKELEPGYKEAQQRITEIERRVASPPPRTPPVAVAEPVAEPVPPPELPRPAPVAPTRPAKKQEKKKVSYL
jgi:tetratricopeptide (TPR) repeat protein